MDSGSEQPQETGWDHRVVRWWSLAFRRPEEHRLAAALAASEIALGARAKVLASPRAGVTDGTIGEALRRARKAYVRGALDEGWACLEEAHRLAVFAATPDELRGRAVALRAEASHKLRGWRRDAVIDLATAVIGAEGDPNPALLYEALLHRDGFHQNRYYQTRLLARQFKTVGAYLVIALGAAWALARLGVPIPIAADPTVPGADPAANGVVVWMMLFGLLGASFSVAFPLTSGSDGRHIPDQIQGQAITGFRPLLGAAAGLVAYAFAHADVLNLPASNGALLLSIAFVAGFSERVVLRAIGALTGDPPSPRPRSGRPAEGAPRGRGLASGATTTDGLRSAAVLPPAAVGRPDRRGGSRTERAESREEATELEAPPGAIVRE